MYASAREDDAGAAHVERPQQVEDADAGAEEDRPEPEALGDPLGHAGASRAPSRRAPSGNRYPMFSWVTVPRPMLFCPHRGARASSSPRVEIEVLLRVGDDPARSTSASPGCRPARRATRSRRRAAGGSAARAPSCRRTPAPSSRRRLGPVAQRFGGQHLEHPERRGLPRHGRGMVERARRQARPQIGVLRARGGSRPRARRVPSTSRPLRRRRRRRGDRRFGSTTAGVPHMPASVMRHAPALACRRARQHPGAPVEVDDGLVRDPAREVDPRLGAGRRGSAPRARRAGSRRRRSPPGGRGRRA